MELCRRRTTTSPAIILQDHQLRTKYPQMLVCLIICAGHIVGFLRIVVTLFKRGVLYYGKKLVETVRSSKAAEDGFLDEGHSASRMEELFSFAELDEDGFASTVAPWL